MTIIQNDPDVSADIQGKKNISGIPPWPVKTQMAMVLFSIAAGALLGWSHKESVIDFSSEWRQTANDLTRVANELEQNKNLPDTASRNDFQNTFDQLQYGIQDSLRQCEGVPAIQWMRNAAGELLSIHKLDAAAIPCIRMKAAEYIKKSVEKNLPQPDFVWVALSTGFVGMLGAFLSLAGISQYRYNRYLKSRPATPTPV